VQGRRVNEVIVAVRQQRGGVLPLRDLLECRIHGVRVVDETACVERQRGEFPIASLKASWLIYGHGFEQGLTRTVAKRIVDVAGSLVLLLISAPVMALAALAVAVESPGAVLFRQERVGLGGRSFQVLKFRSMRNGQVTRVGTWLRHTGIDELPQFVNVCRGEMSVVGPRPLTSQDIERLGWAGPEHDWRLAAKPGITGLAQLLAGRGARSSERLDRLYLRRQSLSLDLKIIALSFAVNIAGKAKVRRFFRGCVHERKLPIMPENIRKGLLRNVD